MKIIAKLLLSCMAVFFALLAGSGNIFAFQEEVKASKDEVQVPILMYHFLSKSNENPNRWKITPEEFESDLAFLKKEGYESVFIKDLINYVYEGRSLPDKPVVISFDDGDSSVHRYAFPLLQKYNMKAVVSIIGQVTDEYSAAAGENIEYYPNLTWQQVRELKASGLFEIQNHSYGLHSGQGSTIKDGESTSDYSDRFSGDLQKLQQRMQEELGEEPTAFIYPFGNKSSESTAILKENGFYASMTCYEKINTIKTGHPEDLFDLGRILRPRGIESSVALKMLKAGDQMQ